MAASNSGVGAATRARRAMLRAACVALSLSAMACNRGEPGAATESAAAGPWQAGTHHTYAVSLDSQVGLEGAPHMMKLGLRGKLELDVVHVEGDVVQLQLRVDEATVETDSDRGRRELDAVLPVLAQPHLVTLVGGAVDAVRTPRAAPPFSVSILTTLASGLQLADSDRGTDSWIALERDATGRHEVEYTPAAEGRVAKRKLRYEALAVPGNGYVDVSTKLEPQVVSSSGTVRVEDGRIESVEQVEELSIPMGPGPGMRSSTRMSLTSSSVSKPEQAIDLAALRADTVPAQGPRIEHEGNPRPDLDMARIGGRSFDQIVAELVRQREAGASTLPVGVRNGVPLSPDDQRIRREALGQASQTFIALAAILRREPDKIDRVVELVKAGSPASKQLMNGLASANTGPAQQALGSLVVDPALASEHRRQAATSLIRTRTPSDASVELLKGLLDDPKLSVHAIYGLGTYSRLLRGQGRPEQADRLGKLLVERLAAAETTLQRTHAMRGLANAQYTAAFDDVSKHLDDDEASVRAAAVHALRPMKHADVERLVAAAVREDRDPMVRLAALDAIRDRGYSQTFASAATHVLQNDDRQRCRRSALRIVGSWLSDHPELRSLVQQVATEDGEARMRQAAQAELDSRAVSG